jgi:hypothetical protein
MTIIKSMQNALNEQLAKVDAKLAIWADKMSLRDTEIYKALQKLWDLLQGLKGRIEVIETAIGGLGTGSAALPPTVSRGTFEVESAANLLLQPLNVGESYTPQMIYDALFSLNSLSPQTGTYAFKLLDGMLPYSETDDAGIVTSGLFDTNDTMYVTVLDGGAKSIKLSKIGELDTTLVNDDLTVGDPNFSATLSQDFLDSLI